MERKLPTAPSTWPPEEQIYHDRWVKLLEQAIRKVRALQTQPTPGENRNQFHDEWPKIVAILHALAAQYARVPRRHYKDHRIFVPGDYNTNDYDDSVAPEEYADWAHLPLHKHLPAEAARIIQEWRPIFIDPFSGYLNKRISLAYPKQGTERISNQWNVCVGSTDEITARTDESVPDWHWAHAVQKGQEVGIWSVNAIWPPKLLSAEQQDLKRLVDTLREEGIHLDELLKIYGIRDADRSDTA